MYITVDEVKKHLNINDTFTEDDNYISALILACEGAIAKHLNVYLTDLEDDKGDIPAPLKQALLLLVGNYYANRESVAYTTAVEIPNSYNFLIDLYRNYGTGDTTDIGEIDLEELKKAIDTEIARALAAEDSLDLRVTALENSGGIVDDEMSETSENPVQNKVITAVLNNKAALEHTHTTTDITDFPTKVSAFTNDAGYLTEHLSLDGYATKEDLDTKLDKGDYVTDTTFTEYKTEVNTALANKLDAGDYIDSTALSEYTYDKATIDEKVAGGGTFDPTQYYNKTATDELLAAKQNTLTAGDNITITDNVISATGGGTEYTAGTSLEITDDNVINSTLNLVNDGDCSIKMKGTYTHWSGTEVDCDNTVEGKASAAFGSNITISANTYQNFVAGYDNSITKGSYSAVFGTSNKVSESEALVGGESNTVSGEYGFAAGRNNTISAMYGATIGCSNTVSGQYGFAAGYNNKAGAYSYMIGEYNNNRQAYDYTYALGSYNTVSGQYSAAIGSSNKAYGYASTAIGYSNAANSYASTAIGMSNSASANGQPSVAIGQSNQATGKYSVAIGEDNYAVNEAEVALGQYNKFVTSGSDTTHNGTKFTIGDGSINARSNVLQIMADGYTYIKGIGDYDGTNWDSAKSLQEVISEGGGGSVTVDSELSDTSENPVQNKVITAKITEIESTIGNISTLLDTINGEEV